jgi:hypothetical protein
MRTSTQQSSRLQPRLLAWLTAFALAVPAMAHAQYGAPDLDSTAIGEKYHAEVAFAFWNPTVDGIISSEQFGLLGSKIDFVNDLGFEKTQIKDLRIVLRPSKKAKFRIGYTPIEYVAESNLKRDIIFNGQKFPVNLPVQSEFDWKVWRFGFEYDVLYRSRGFVGFLVEGRYTQMTAQLASPLLTEYTTARAPLPAIGVVGRAYVLPELALNFELSTFRVPSELIEDVEANYYDWNIHGTFNINNYVGIQVGWRRLSNYLSVENDLGDVKFQGLWFGGALRY